MTLRSMLIKVWQRKLFETTEIISLLELSDANIETIAEVLISLEKRKISVNEAEEMLREAREAKDERRKRKYITC